MLNLCVYLHDFHNVVDPENKYGLSCGDLYIGSPCFADDVMLMSGSKHGLNNMMELAYDFSRKWRFTFSASKSKCMVFGESKRKNCDNSKKRVFPFGTDTLEEVTHCTHLGVTLCSYDSSSKRTEEACDKGRRQLATLHSSGVRSNGLYPFVCSFLWNRICLPSMLHGCELWNSMNQYELNDLEQTQSRTFRLIQNIPPRTHSVLTRGLLGQLTINCHVKLQKLMFLQRLAAASPKLLVKQMFLRRLYEFIQNPIMKGFIPDIHHILNSVDFTDTLLIYMQGGRFPSKREWRGICRISIRTHDYNINVNNLRDTDARYARQMARETHPQRHPFYDVIKRSRDIRHNVSLLWLIRTLTLPGYGYDTRTCTLCGKIYEDIMIHVIAECPKLFQERNTLWDFIVDDLNVNLSVRLSCLSDLSFVDVISGRPWSGFDDTLTQEELDSFYINIAMILHKNFHKAFIDNYSWFH